MICMELDELVEQTLFGLKSSGMTSHALQYYKHTGFGAIQERHAELGETVFSNEICNDLIHDLRICFENGTIPKHKWRVIRRCAEVMSNYQETGTTELPNLGKWEWLNAPYRVKPTPEQFADSDNIFAIVWKVERELEAAGMTTGSVKAYTYNGFDKLLKHFITLGVTKYDSDVINGFVADTHEKLVDRSKFQMIRKTAALVHEYHQTGEIVHKWLEQWDKHKPDEYFASTIEAYENNCRRKDSCSPRSASSSQHAISQFLMTLEVMGHYDFQSVTLKTVSDCVSILAKRYTSGLKPTLSYIRTFLRFLFEHEMISIDLVKAIPGSVSPKRAVYSGFTAEETDKLFAAVDQSMPQGKRDYAMLLIGAKTGMRAIDVVNLKRQDIDWRGNAINIVQSKTNQPLGIHLSAEVGNAIADYILNGRPDCDSPNIFLRSTYPVRQLTAAACGNIVRKYFRKAGLASITNRPIGFHTLRRTFGANLLEAGVSVDMIQELLGQLDINSTQPYLAASEQGLKKCAIGLIPLSGTEGGAQS